MLAHSFRGFSPQSLSSIVLGTVAMLDMGGVVYSEAKLLILPQPGSKNRKDWNPSVLFTGMFPVT